MISASKRTSLRLTLQPFTPHISLSDCPSPRVSNMVSISSSTVPCTPRLSPVPDIYMASPTPTKGSFVLTPTRLGSPLQDPRSPVLSVCISEECANVVLGERTACGECKISIHAILAKAPLRTFTPAITWDHNKPKPADAPQKDKSILSVAHPRPLPPAPLTSPIKALIGGEPTSPDALYFGAGRRKRRPSGLVGGGRLGSGKRPFLSLAPAQAQAYAPELPTKKKEESWLEMVDEM